MADTTTKTATTDKLSKARKGKVALTAAEKATRAAARKLETPAARFTRVTTPRIRKVLAGLRRLETIGRSNGYDYTPEQAARVMEYLDGAVEKVRMSFVNRVADKKGPTITL